MGLKVTKSNLMMHGTSAKASLWPRTSLEGPVDQVVAAKATVAAATVVEETMVAVEEALVVEEVMVVEEAMVAVAATMVEEAGATEVARAKVGDCCCAARHNFVKPLAHGLLHEYYLYLTARYDLNAVQFLAGVCQRSAQLGLSRR